MKELKSIAAVENITLKVNMKCLYWLKTSELETTLFESKSKIMESCLTALDEQGVDVSDISNIKLSNESLKV